MKTKATDIVTGRPHRVQVTVPSQPSPLTNRVPHPPVPGTPTLASTLLLKLLRALSPIVSHHCRADNALELHRTLCLSPFVSPRSPSSLPAYSALSPLPLAIRTPRCPVDVTLYIATLRFLLRSSFQMSPSCRFGMTPLMICEKGSTYEAGGAGSV
jgi:hypothetical protein